MDMRMRLGARISTSDERVITRNENIGDGDSEIAWRDR